MGENTRPFPIQSWIGKGKLSQKIVDFNLYTSIAVFDLIGITHGS